MAYGLKNFPNILPPDGDYLSGRIKDDNGDGLGTPINQMTNGDLQEFFARLMKYAGIEPNDLPDSEYTGHQYIQALVKHLNYKIGKPIVEGLIGGYTTNDLIVLEGVVITLSNSSNTATWTAGYIYYNNLIYFVDAGTSTKSSGVFLYVISDIDNFKISISHGTSGSGIADYGASSVKPFYAIGHAATVYSGITDSTPNLSVGSNGMSARKLGNVVKISGYIAYSASGAVGGTNSVIALLQSFKLVNGTDFNIIGNATWFKNGSSVIPIIIGGANNFAVSGNNLIVGLDNAVVSLVNTDTAVLTFDLEVVAL